MSKGKKFDNGKPRFELIPLNALEGAASVMAFGAEKYGEFNWMGLENAEQRYTGALLRHLAAVQSGEVNDPESGFKHIDHVLCNAIFLAYLQKGK